MNTLKICQACGEGKLHSKSELTVYTYKGKDYNIKMHFSECDNCGSELTNAEDASKTDRIIDTIRNSTYKE